MSMDVYVIQAEPASIKHLRVGAKEIVPRTAEKGPIAVQLQEVLNSVTESVAASLEVESKLEIEISGSLGFEVEAGTKYLFFNVGGKTSATGQMKVTLSTTLKPRLEAAVDSGG